MQNEKVDYRVQLKAGRATIGVNGVTIVDENVWELLRKHPELQEVSIRKSLPFNTAVAQVRRLILKMKSAVMRRF